MHISIKLIISQDGLLQLTGIPIVQQASGSNLFTVFKQLILYPSIHFFFLIPKTFNIKNLP